MQCAGVHDVHQRVDCGQVEFRKPCICQRTRFVYQLDVAYSATHWFLFALLCLWRKQFHITFVVVTIISIFPPNFLLFVSIDYLCHVYVRNDSLGAVVIADNEYPSRVCFSLLDKVGVRTAVLLTHCIVCIPAHHFHILPVPIVSYCLMHVTKCPCVLKCRTKTVGMFFPLPLYLFNSTQTVVTEKVLHMIANLKIYLLAMSGAKVCLKKQQFCHCSEWQFAVDHVTMWCGLCLFERASVTSWKAVPAKT